MFWLLDIYIYFIHVLISFGSILRFLSACIECLWTAPRMLTIVMIRGLIAHLAVLSVWMS